jgi:hypothetical protein
LSSLGASIPTPAPPILLQPSDSKPNDSRPGGSPLDVIIRHLPLAVACCLAGLVLFYSVRLYLQRGEAGSSTDLTQPPTALSDSNVEPREPSDTAPPPPLSSSEAPAPNVASESASSAQPPQDPAEFSISLTQMPFAQSVMGGSNKLEITLMDGGPLTLEEVLFNGHEYCAYSLVKERDEIRCVEKWNRLHPATTYDDSDLSALKKSCGEHSVFAGGNNSSDKYKDKGRILNTGDQWIMFFDNDLRCGERIVRVDLLIDQSGSEYAVKYGFDPNS